MVFLEWKVFCRNIRTDSLHSRDVANECRAQSQLRMLEWEKYNFLEYAWIQPIATNFERDSRQELRLKL